MCTLTFCHSSSSSASIINTHVLGNFSLSWRLCWGKHLWGSGNKGFIPWRAWTCSAWFMTVCPLDYENLLTQHWHTRSSKDNAPFQWHEFTVVFLASWQKSAVYPPIFKLEYWALEEHLWSVNASPFGEHAQDVSHGNLSVRFYHFMCTSRNFSPLKVTEERTGGHSLLSSESHEKSLNVIAVGQ